LPDPGGKKIAAARARRGRRIALKIERLEPSTMVHGI